MAEGGVVSPKSCIECTICLGKFKQPKLLPCHHTFCATCLERYIERSRKGNRFECPLCRKAAEVPETGVAGFQTNFYIDTADTEDESVPCEGCNDNVTADHRCLDCEENYCTRCTESHMKMKPSRHHKLMELKTADPNVKRKLKARAFCRKHPNEEIKVVCKQCNKLLCVLCMLTDHQGHKSREVTEEAKDAREKLRTITEKQGIDDVLGRQNKIINNLKKTKSRLKSSLDHDKKAIRDQGARLHQAVDQAVEQLEKKVMKQYDETIEENATLTKLSETFSSSLTSLLSTVCQFIEQFTDIEIIEKCETLNTQLLTEIDNEPGTQRDNDDHDKGPLFSKGEIDVRLLENMIGSVICSNRKTPRMTTRPKLTLIKDKLIRAGSLKVGDMSRLVGDIAPISKDCAWVCGWGDSKLKQIDSAGKSLLALEVPGTRYNSITTDDKDNCIISCDKEKSIKRVTTTGKVETIVSGTGGEPCGLAYRRKSDNTEEVLFACNGTSGGDSAVFVAPYRVGAKATRWSSGYKYIYRVDVDHETDNVCISDHRGKCVIVLDGNGKVLSKHQTPDYGLFNVCFDIQGGILFTNGDRQSSVQRIKADGTALETLTNVIGFTISVDRNGRIWVGKENGAIDWYELK